MTHIIRRLFLPSVAALFLVTACNTTQPAAPPPAGGGNGGGSGPIPIAFTLDTGHAQSANVTGAGASLSATGADGTTYTLDVPAGALTVPTKLTLTPLQDVSIAGAKAAWQVGVELQPQGTAFLQAVTLTIDTPQSSPSSAAIAFVTSDGTRYVPMATGTSGSTFTAELEHFSDYVVGPTTPSILGDAIRAILENLASPPTTVDAGSLIRLWAQAQDSTLSTLRDDLDRKIAAEIAALGQKEQNDTDPPPGEVIGLVNDGSLAAGAGRTNDVADLDQAARQAFATLLGRLRAQRTLAGGDFATYNGLVSPLARARAIAAAYPAVLVGSLAAVDSEAQSLVSSMLADADGNCNHAHFTTGSNQLLDVIGAVHLLEQATPSDADLHTDADNCVPPSITSVTVDPIMAAQAVSDYDSPTTNVTVHAPLTTTTVTDQHTFQAQAMATYAQASTELDVAVAGGDSATFTTSGIAQASNPQLNHVAKSTALVGGCTSLTVNIAHVRGDYQVTSTWTVGTAQQPSGPGSATLTFHRATPSGSATDHRMGTHYAAGDTVTNTTFDGIYPVCIDLQANVEPGDNLPNTDVASIQGTIAIQVAPDPNGPVQ